MTLIKKKKDSAESASPESKEQAKVCEESCGDCGNPQEEIEAGASGSDVSADKNGETQADAAQGDETSGETKPTEIDFLKAYLKQALEEAKRQKDENAALKAQQESKDAQIKQLRERYDGLAAEYDNYRRRTSAEKESLGTDATAKAVLALLPALDNLERAMPFAQTNPESFTKGVEMTLRQLEEAFKMLGVEEIEAAGAPFDPGLHEAVMHEEDDSVGESLITGVFQKGYRMGDKVVRHSVVKVAN